MLFTPLRQDSCRFRHAQPGESGSPVITDEGKVVGVLFATAPQTAYAVPVRPYLVDLVREARDP